MSDAAISALKSIGSAPNSRAATSPIAGSLTANRYASRESLLKPEVPAAGVALLFANRPSDLAGYKIDIRDPSFAAHMHAPGRRSPIFLAPRHRRG